MTSQPKKRNAIRVVDKLRQKSVQHYMSQIDWQGSSEFPLVVEFDPTSKCNLACPDCISGSLLNQGAFTSERVEELVNEMIEMGVKGVILIGGGEPMMHPRAGWIIETLGKHGVSVGITTNGLYLKKYMDITTEHADWVRVSVDAASAETFGRIRPSRSGASLFDEVIDAMREFGRRKRGKLGYSFMVFNEGSYGFQGISVSSDTAKQKIVEAQNKVKTNVHEIYAAAQLAKEIGCDYFEVKPMYDVNHFSVLQKAAIADVVEEELIKCRRLEDDKFQVIEALKLQATLRGESNLEPKSYTRCHVAQMRTLVTSSGVYVCPYFRGVEHKKIGDAHTTSLKDMWNGDSRLSKMSQLNPSVDCPMHCIRNDSNLYVEKIAKDGFDEAIDDYDIFI